VRPVQTTPVVEEKVEKTETISDEAVETVAVSTAASLVAIFVIIGLLLICCFGFGTLILCSYQISKASKEIVSV